MDIKFSVDSSLTMLSLLRTNSIIAGMSFIAVQSKHYNKGKIILLLSLLINIIYTFFFMTFHYKKFKNHDEKILYYYSPILFSVLYSFILIALYLIY